jgi:hypothetical protein
VNSDLFTLNLDSCITDSKADVQLLMKDVTNSFAEIFDYIRRV